MIPLPKLKKDRHKYEAGYVVGFAGSKAMSGAAKLAGWAALKAGAGIVRLFSQNELDNAPWELICEKWTQKAWNTELKRASAAFMGPGLVKPRIRHVDIPCVYDAAALQKGQYPKNAILTPHAGELERIEPQKEAIIVVKGYPTRIFVPGEKVIEIARGDPGMATAGSGDVLTGIIAALLAQGMKPKDAAILGVTLHASAGEFAAREKTSYCMTASDIIDALPLAFKNQLTKR